MPFLITPALINEIAYLSPLPESSFKSSIIRLTQELDIFNILTSELYSDVIANPLDYPELITNYIQPAMAFRIKYRLLNLALTENALSPAPFLTESINDDIKASEILAQLHIDLLKSFTDLTYNVSIRWVSGVIVDPLSKADSGAIPSPIVPIHSHQCAELFLNDPLHPGFFMDLCNWQTRIEFLCSTFSTRVVDIPVLTETFVTFIDLNIPLPNGNYKYSFFVHSQLASTINSMFFQASTDNGISWLPWQHEPKDTTDVDIESGFFIVEISDGSSFFMLQARLENDANTGNVISSTLLIEPKS